MFTAIEQGRYRFRLIRSHEISISLSLTALPQGRKKQKVKGQCRPQGCRAGTKTPALHPSLFLAWRLIGLHYLRTHYDPLLIKLRLCRGVNPVSDSEIGISGFASETSTTFKIPFHWVTPFISLSTPRFILFILFHTFELPFLSLPGTLPKIFHDSIAALVFPICQKW